MIPCNHLPSSLWQHGVLYIPDFICDVYEANLKKLGLYQQALAFEPWRGGYGGESREETHRHFSTFYLNSLSRVQCVILDPHVSFATIPRELLLTLSSHCISILDIPCGAGAGVIAFMGTLRELRLSGCIPMTPLTVEILGADISEHALDIYHEQMTMLKQHMAAVGISVRLETRPWNAADVQQTNGILDEYLLNQGGHNECLVLIANFSGAGERHFEKFEDSFRQIWIRLSGTSADCSTILWVEPEMSVATSFFKRLLKLINPYRWFRRASAREENYRLCKYDWYARLQKKTVGSGVLVQKYSRAK